MKETLFNDNFKFIKEDFSKRLIRLDDALRAITPENATHLPYDQLVILMTARKKLKSVPIVDAVEVVHGRWFMRGGRFRCSECDAVALLKLDINVGGYREYGHFRSSYCPNCGAKMDLKGE